MAEASTNDILQYYKRELSYLRLRGAEFAKRYPKVAQRLALHDAESVDPHTERLIEATAFLAARVHRDLDQNFPQVAAAMLENLCPTLVRPVPSMSVARFELDTDCGKVTSGYPIARHSSLHANTEDGKVCRFRTAWNTVLWPLWVRGAALSEERALWLDLECPQGMALGELELHQLRIHLHGDWMTVMPLYEALAASVQGISIHGEGGASQCLPATAWREVGFAEDESALSEGANALPAYALLQEYATFPRKFHFFDLQLPRGLPFPGRACRLEFRLGKQAQRLTQIEAENFRLGCVPVVNLYSRISEPIAIDGTQYEYRLSADWGGNDVSEVHSIRSVTVSDPAAERAVEVPSYAAMDHFDAEPGAMFWSMRRDHSLQGDAVGTDVFLSFVDGSRTHHQPDEPVVYADLLCTNRGHAERILAGAPMAFEKVAHNNVLAHCLYAPTAQRRPPLGSETLWRLVSILTLNHLSVTDPAEGAKRLRETLLLFARGGRRDQDLIRGIKAVHARAAMAHIGDHGWRGLCHGTEMAIEFETEAFVGGSPLLLGAVLARYFAMQAMVNSFVRLVVRRGEEIWRRWEPMAGRQQLL